MNRFLLLLLPWPLVACHAQNEHESAVLQAVESANNRQTDVEVYASQFPDDGLPSSTTGSPGNGTLKNGKLMPFSGPNFEYFDALSYCNDRAFVHSSVKASVLGTYQQLETALPGRQFGLMECAHQHGGKLQPHRTHQNGMSVDFMSPLQKGGQPYYKLDHTGATHYLLEFNNSGQYERDTNISIDFDAIARHLLLLEKQARANGLKIAKVLLKIELKEELFATPHGKQLKASGIYLAQSLTPFVNSLHDDHYHVDFAVAE